MNCGEPMAKFYVWDPVNESEDNALEVEAEDAHNASVIYAEQDVDGDIDGLYIRKGGGPIIDMVKDGHPIHVRDENEVITRWRVGVVGLEPLFDAIQVQGKD